MKKIVYTLTIFCALLSCDSKNNGSSEENLKSSLENQLLITNEGDSLEDGYWKYNNEKNKIYKDGFYENGYKVRRWNYSYREDSTSITWKIFNKGKVKFNYPAYLRTIDSVEYPVLFEGDIVDGNSNTYVALLTYDLEKLNAGIYDYLYQANQRREIDSIEVLKSMELKKFYFKKINIFKYHVQLEREAQMYEVISYIFEVNNKLFDLTLKNTTKNISNIDNEVFNDMLYSMQFDGIDLFTYNSGQYYKEEDVVFE